MKFNSMWEAPNENKPLVAPKLPKYIYDEVVYRPGAKDEKGKLINDTRFDKVVKGSKTSLQDYIQSFGDSTDVYKILERCARSGDYSVLVGDASYGDCSMYSADRAVNDKTLKNLESANGKAPSELAQALLNGASDDEILSIIENLKSKNNATVDSSSAASEEVNNNA